MFHQENKLSNNKRLNILLILVKIMLLVDFLNFVPLIYYFQIIINQKKLIYLYKYLYLVMISLDQIHYYYWMMILLTNNNKKNNLRISLKNFQIILRMNHFLM